MVMGINFLFACIFRSCILFGVWSTLNENHDCRNMALSSDIKHEHCSPEHEYTLLAISSAYQGTNKVINHFCISPGRVKEALSLL